MKKILKTLTIIMTLAGFVSCSKGNNTPEQSKADGFFSAKLMMNAELANAIETAVVEYKDANGKLVTEKVNFSSLPTVDNEDFGKLHVYSKEVTFKNFPADVYFTVNVTKKSGLTYTEKTSLIYIPLVESGRKDKSQLVAYKSFGSEIKNGIRVDGVHYILDGVISRINAAKAEGTIN